MGKESKETQLQKDAFEYYYKTDPRSYAKTALWAKKAMSTIERWGSEHKWVERAEDRDAKKRKSLVEKAEVDKELDYQQRNLRIVKRGILEHAKAITEGLVTPTYKSLIDLMNYEDRIRTGRDSRVEVAHYLEIRGMDNVQLTEKVREIAHQIVNMRQMETLDGTKLIEAEYKEVPAETKADDKVPQKAK